MNNDGTIKEQISNTIIAFSMLVGMTFVYVFETMITKISIPQMDVNNMVDLVDVIIDVCLYGVSFIIAHPLTIIMLVAFMIWFTGKLK